MSGEGREGRESRKQEAVTSRVQQLEGSGFRHCLVVESSPRKRGSKFGRVTWIPACAGMTPRSLCSPCTLNPLVAEPCTSRPGLHCFLLTFSRNVSPHGR